MSAPLNPAAQSRLNWLLANRRPTTPPWAAIYDDATGQVEEQQRSRAASAEYARRNEEDRRRAESNWRKANGRPAGLPWATIYDFEQGLAESRRKSQEMADHYRRENARLRGA